MPARDTRTTVYRSLSPGNRCVPASDYDERRLERALHRGEFCHWRNDGVDLPSWLHVWHHLRHA
eukprot:COSAG01_NODE_52472_length_346_cov_1.145749_1_plen_63_part_10